VDRRSLIFVLLALAIGVNMSLFFLDDHITSVPDGIDGEDGDEGRSDEVFTIPSIRGGSSFRVSSLTNISVLRSVSGSVIDQGSYLLEAVSDNSIYGDASVQRTIGEYRLSYRSQDEPSVDLRGPLDRTRTISYGEASSVSTSMDTTVGVQGPIGGLLSSYRSRVELPSVGGVWSDLSWMVLLGSVPYSHGGQGEVPLDLDLADLGIDNAAGIASWSSRTEGSAPGRTMTIEVHLSPSGDVELDLLAVFVEGQTWPTRFVVDSSGSYLEEGEEIGFEFLCSMDLISHTSGPGKDIPVPLLIGSGSVAGPVHDPVRTSEVIEEGEGTGLRFSPREALSTAQRSGAITSAFLRDGEVTFAGLRYFRNDTVQSSMMMVWNMTLVSSQASGQGLRSLTIEVGAPISADRIDLDRTVLLSESEGSLRHMPAAGRPLITLHDNEEVVSACELSASLMPGGRYAPTYELLVVAPSGAGRYVNGILSFNLLGIGKSSSDVLVSSAQEDGSELKAVVVDARDGHVVSYIHLEVGGLSLIESFGSGLA